MGLTRFKLQPKYHVVGELIFQLQFERSRSMHSINPLSFSTQIDEDYVGRLSTFSRSVSSRTVHKRTIQKFLLALGSLW